MRERRQRAMLSDKHFVRRQRVADHHRHNSLTTSLPHERSIDISQQIVEDDDSNESDDEIDNNNNDNSNSNDRNVVSSEKDKAQTKKRRVPVA